MKNVCTKESSVKDANIRECGSCTLCCTVVACRAMEKPINVTCQYCNADTGCSIHPTRPQMCKDFQCAWLRGELPDWMRPDKVHIVVEVCDGYPLVLTLADPAHQHDWRTKQVVSALQSIYLQVGTAVIASDRLTLVPHAMTVDEVWGHAANYARQLGELQ